MHPIQQTKSQEVNILFLPALVGSIVVVSVLLSFILKQIPEKAESKPLIGRATFPIQNPNEAGNSNETNHKQALLIEDPLIKTQKSVDDLIDWVSVSSPKDSSLTEPSRYCKKNA